MAGRIRVLELSHPWLDAIRAHPDDARDLIAAAGAPFPARLGDEPVALVGRRSGITIHVRRFPSGGDYIERIVGSPGKAASWPGDVVPGEPRADVHQRLGAPRSTDGGIDRWSLDEGRYFAITFGSDGAERVELGLAD